MEMAYGNKWTGKAPLKILDSIVAQYSLVDAVISLHKACKPTSTRIIRYLCTALRAD